jgi:transcriptional regulator with XRE-family HTH domain
VDSNSLGQFIQNRRSQMHLTQMDLAIRLKKRGFSYSVQTIGHWENGRVKPPLDLNNDSDSFLEALASILEVPALRILEVAGYLSGIDFKFDVETYEVSKLFERATPSQRKMVKQMLEELIRNNEQP